MSAKDFGMKPPAQSRPCSCGSGLERFELSDAAGIFCSFVCDGCEGQVRKRYNPRIFDASSTYASTGEESDIDAED